MTIDIRNIPVLYINMDDEKERDVEMRQMLTNLGFINFDRFGACSSQHGPDGCFLSHLNAARQLYTNSDSDYVLIMEDDILIYNITELNTLVRTCIERYDPDVISAYYRVPIPYGGFESVPEFISSPPLSGTACTYFVLCKRSALPKIMNHYCISYIRYRVLDIWSVDSNIKKCTIYGNNVIGHSMNYYISRTDMKDRILCIHVLNSIDNGVTFKDIVSRCDNHLLTMYIHRVYTINGNTVTELTHRNIIKNYTVNSDFTDTLQYMIQNLQKQAGGRFVKVMVIKHDKPI